MHAAGRNNCICILRRILDIHDINVNIKSVEYRTALNTAIDSIYNWWSCCNGFLLLRAEHLKAFENNNSELVQLLASRYPEDKYNFVHFRNLLESCKNPLYTATERNDLDMIWVLIKLGFTVKLKWITDDEHLESFEYTFFPLLYTKLPLISTLRCLNYFW